MRLGTVGVDHLRGDQLAVRIVECSPLILRHGIRIGAGKCTGRFDTHRANRIAEHRRDCLEHGRDGEGGNARGTAERTSGLGSAMAALIAASDAGVA